MTRAGYCWTLRIHWLRVVGPKHRHEQHENQSINDQRADGYCLHLRLPRRTRRYFPCLPRRCARSIERLSATACFSGAPSRRSTEIFSDTRLPFSLPLRLDITTLLRSYSAVPRLERKCLTSTSGFCFFASGLAFLSSSKDCALLSARWMLLVARHPLHKLRIRQRPRHRSLRNRVAQGPREVPHRHFPHCCTDSKNLPRC